MIFGGGSAFTKLPLLHKFGHAYGTSTANMTTITLRLLQIDSQNSRKRSFRLKELRWFG